jgi:hypothetical protein
MRKYAVSCANIAQTMCTLCAKLQTLRKQAVSCSNQAQTKRKSCANHAQTLSKPCANLAQTLRNPAQSLLRFTAQTPQTSLIMRKHAQTSKTPAQSLTKLYNTAQICANLRKLLILCVKPAIFPFIWLVRKAFQAPLQRGPVWHFWLYCCRLESWLTKNLMPFQLVVVTGALLQKRKELEIQLGTGQ